MPRGKTRVRPDQPWTTFKRRHEGNPFLKEDPLYSLTEVVIDAIKQHLPDFFSEEQEQFERDLARMTGGGFFLRRPLGQPTFGLLRPGITIGEVLEYLPLPKKDDG